jgi:NADH-quinone oxidoreductase subunit M
VFLGPVTDASVASAADLRPRELLIAGVMGLLVLAGGLFPNWVQGVTANAANAWVARMAADRTSAESVAQARATPSKIGEY